MTYPTSLTNAAQRATHVTSTAVQDPAAASQAKPQLRRYEIMSLLPNGDIAETRHIAPALPVFEDAFCAFTRGSIMETDMGPIAIEDLLPGDQVLSRDGKPHSVLWKGRTTLVPGRPGPKGRNLHLTRIMADSFGIQRPMSCVIAGPSARLLNTPDHLRAVAGGRQVLTPVQEFWDGMNVIETAPPTPVELFHVSLARHCVVRIGGLEFETYHPGLNAVRMMSHAMRTLFLNLFPHINQPGDFGELAFPRSGDDQIDAITA